LIIHTRRSPACLTPEAGIWIDVVFSVDIEGVVMLGIVVDCTTVADGTLAHAVNGIKPSPAINNINL